MKLVHVDAKKVKNVHVKVNANVMKIATVETIANVETIATVETIASVKIKQKKHVNVNVLVAVKTAINKSFNELLFL
jgi:hypothetical protein